MQFTTEHGKQIAATDIEAGTRIVHPAHGVVEVEYVEQADNPAFLYVVYHPMHRGRALLDRTFEQMIHKQQSMLLAASNDTRSPERIELDEAYELGTMTTSEYDAAVDELRQYSEIAREVGVTVRQVEDVATHLAKIANEAGRAAAIDRRFAKYDDPHGFDTFVEAHVTKMSPENFEKIASDRPESVWMSEYMDAPTELDRRLSDYSPE